MPSSKNTVTEQRFQEIVDGINNNTIDYATVTVQEWLEVSFLMLFHGEESHIDIKIMYGGGVYGLHSCISGVAPPEKVAGLKEPM